MSKDNEISLLETPISELEDKLLNEYNSDEVKNIIDIFNLNLKKKNVIRTAKLSELQDKISDQMEQRIEKNADAFSNKDLLDYFRTIQETVNKSDTSSEVKIPVQINQQQINLNMQNELNRESKEKVIAAIRSILEKSDKTDTPLNFENDEVIDVELQNEQ